MGQVEKVKKKRKLPDYPKTGLARIRKKGEPGRTSEEIRADQLANPGKAHAIAGFVSKFEESMIAQVYEHMALGNSIVQLCVKLKICPKTFYAWCNPQDKAFIPEFAEAVEYGRLLTQDWWERTGQQGLHQKVFNSSTYIFMMKNRFKSEYGDAPQVFEHKIHASPLIDALKKSAVMDWGEDVITVDAKPVDDSESE